MAKLLAGRCVALSGIYRYRLVDVSNDGIRTEHEVRQVMVEATTEPQAPDDSCFMRSHESRGRSVERAIQSCRGKRGDDRVVCCRWEASDCAVSGASYEQGEQEIVIDVKGLSRAATRCG